MKKGCGTVVYRQYELDRVLEAIKKAGYDYFETQSTNPWCNHVIIAQDDPVKFAEKAKSHGFLGVTSLWTNEGALIPGKETCVDTIKRTIEWAAAAGIPVVDFGDGHKPAEMSEADAFKILSDRILEILETAEKCKVKFALEPHGTFSLTGNGLEKILSISSSPYLGINYDCANVFRASYVETKNGVASWEQAGSGEDEVKVLERIVSRVVHFHAKDLDCDKKCVALGEGSVKVKECIEILRKSGYTGAVSLETEGGMSFEDCDAIAQKSSVYLDKVL